MNKEFVGNCMVEEDWDDLGQPSSMDNSSFEESSQDDDLDDDIMTNSIR